MKDLERIMKIRQQSVEVIREFRQDVRRTNHGCLKIMGLELIPFVMGAALAGTGRSTGLEWIPAVPPVMDLFHNCEGIMTWRGLLDYVKYGLGVAAVYVDKVIPYIGQVYEKM